MNTAEFLTESGYAVGIEKIKQDLAAVCRNGFVTSFDGCRLYYEFFEASSARATVVVVHGLSEFTKKYYELTHALLGAGFNVLLYDQRCHGYSDRLTDDIQLIHVNEFSDYIRDLDVIINVARKFAELPIFIYSNSMGGAVSAFYLAEHKDTVKGAVMAAPMLRPRVGGIPVPAVRAMLFFCELIQGKSARFIYSKDFNPEHRFKNTSDASYSRFCHNLNTRKSDPHYQSTPMSVGWVRRSFSIKRKLLLAACSIETPTLLLTPECDTVVEIPPQYEFARRCKSCTLKAVKNAKHSMLTGSDQTVHRHIRDVIEFYSSI